MCPYDENENRNGNIPGEENAESVNENAANLNDGAAEASDACDNAAEEPDGSYRRRSISDPGNFSPAPPDKPSPCPPPPAPPENTPQVNRAVLRVALFDAVVEHPYMVGAHATYIHGFQSAHSSVILDLHSGEITEGIGHIVRAEPLQLIARQLLSGYDFLGYKAGCNHHFVQLMLPQAVCLFLLRI